MLCPVCKTECETERICKKCGFDQFRTEFITREDADYWMQNVVIPCREQYRVSHFGYSTMGAEKQYYAKCPICDCGIGRIPVEALNCPVCGFKGDFLIVPIQKEAEAISFYGCLDGEEVVFDNGLTDGVCGMHTYNGKQKAHYHVEGDQLFINMPAGPVSYIITPDFLLNKNGKHSGYIPDSDVFQSKHKWESFTTTVRTFKTSGRYSEKCLGHVNTGFYRRKHELIAYSYPGTSHYGLIAYKNELYAASYVSKNKIKELQHLFGEIDAKTRMR